MTDSNSNRGINPRKRDLIEHRWEILVGPTPDSPPGTDGAVFQFNDLGRFTSTATESPWSSGNWQVSGGSTMADLVMSCPSGSVRLRWSSVAWRWQAEQATWSLVRIEP